VIDALQTTERPGEAFEVQWRQAVKRRVVFVLTAITLWGLVVQTRLIWLQVIQHDYYVTTALNQQRRRVTVNAPRGDILDRHAQVLATSAEGTAITADPSEVEDPAGTAAQLCAALRDCSAKEKADFVTQLSKKKEFVYLRRWRSVSSDKLERVRTLELPGISFMAEPGRYYPNGSLAANYEYGPDGRVSLVIDPKGIQTQTAEVSVRGDRGAELQSAPHVEGRQLAVLQR